MDVRIPNPHRNEKLARLLLQLVEADLFEKPHQLAEFVGDLVPDGERLLPGDVADGDHRAGQGEDADRAVELRRPGDSRGLLAHAGAAGVLPEILQQFVERASKRGQRRGKRLIQPRKFDHGNLLREPHLAAPGPREEFPAEGYAPTYRA